MTFITKCFKICNLIVIKKKLLQKIPPPHVYTMPQYADKLNIKTLNSGNEPLWKIISFNNNIQIDIRFKFKW